MTPQSRTPFQERHFRIKGGGKKVSRREINSQLGESIFLDFLRNSCRMCLIVFGDQASVKIR